MTYTVVPADFDHVEDLAANLREQDRMELAASSGRRPIGALIRSIALSDVAWTALYEGRPCAAWGVCDVGEGRGVAWLLGTEDMYVDRRQAMIMSRRYVAAMHARFPILCNYVDARNTVSRQWLENLGFKARHTESTYGVEGRPFIFYESIHV